MEIALSVFLKSSSYKTSFPWLELIFHKECDITQVHIQSSDGRQYSAATVSSRNCLTRIVSPGDNISEVIF